jgi:hypothetical protein
VNWRSISIPVSKLKIGDQYWGDKVVQEELAHNERLVQGPHMYWKVIAAPTPSKNQQLFWDTFSHDCVVVGVQYIDGGRGSRLYDPNVDIIVRRDLDQKE